MFVRGQIDVPEPEERVRLHQHSAHCRACLCEVARSWLRKTVLNGRVASPGPGADDLEDEYLGVLLNLVGHVS
jgi:hypothetical protein